MIEILSSKELGKQIEDLICFYLSRQKLKLIVRNYTCRYGEIDLIMRDKTTLVFIEVRYRQNFKFGSSLETVNLAKQNKIIKTAEYYLQSHDLFEKISCRFDVIGVRPNVNYPQQQAFISQLKQAQVEWIKNAFSR